MASTLPGPCTGHPPAAPAAAARRAPATRRPRLHLSAQGRAAGQGKPHPARSEPTLRARPCAKCVTGIPMRLLTMALPGSVITLVSSGGSKRKRDLLPSQQEVEPDGPHPKTCFIPIQPSPCLLSPEPWVPAQVCGSRPTLGPSDTPQLPSGRATCPLQDSARCP